MDAFDKLGTICLVLSIIAILPLLFLYKSDFLMMSLLTICFVPLMWIAGLNILEFLTKPFSEKGMKGFLSWVISLVLSLVVYSIFFFILLFVFRALR